MAKQVKLLLNILCCNSWPFPAKGDLTLEPQSKNIVVTCDAKTYLAFTPTDNRAGTEKKRR